MFLFVGFVEANVALMSTNFNTMPICDLFMKKGSGSSALMERPSLRDAAPVGSIVNSFSLLSVDLPNDMFLDYWRKQKKKQVNRMLTFVQVVGDIWEPTLEQCVQLLDGLKNRSISLQQVDSLLEKYGNELRNLERQLINLQKGIYRVKGKPTPSEKWIRECVLRMKQYHHLHTHADAAKLFVDVRDHFGLLGDFSMVENLSRKVYDVYTSTLICLYPNFTCY